MSKRGAEWEKFASLVALHIEGYTIPRYGDMPDDFASSMTSRECITQIEKYVRRFGGIKGGEAQEDMMKVAHYACMVFMKLRGEGKGE